ncbi:9816_t:CDS:2, partial [Gigaspora margarita]
MSSIFISFCFAKTVSGGFTGSYELLILPFEKNAIVLMISLVQAVPILSPDADYVPTPADFPNSSPLLLCLATVIPDSYLPGRRLKVGLTKVLHIIASDIEWTYISNYQSMLAPDKGKSCSRNFLDSQPDDIEEKYASLTSSSSIKKLNITLCSFSGKTAPKANTSTINFMDILSQVQNSSMQSNAKHPSYTPRFTDDQNNTTPSSSNANMATHNNNKSSTPVDNAEPFTFVSLNTPILHQTEPESPKKRQK